MTPSPNGGPPQANGIGRKPLPPLAGGTWEPGWAGRPGSFPSLAGAAEAIKITWTTINSLTSDLYRPCLVSRQRLALTVEKSVRTVGYHIATLKRMHLLFDVRREMDVELGVWRPTARWALDPLKADLWRPRVEEHLVGLAQDDRRSGNWLTKCVKELDTFERGARILAAHLQHEMPVRPPRKKRRRRRKEPRAYSAHGTPRG